MLRTDNCGGRYLDEKLVELQKEGYHVTQVNPSWPVFEKGKQIDTVFVIFYEDGEGKK